MKRYEAMSKEEIMNAYNSINEDCARCVLYKKLGANCCDCSCNDMIADWLKADVAVEKATRVSTINTRSELDDAFYDWFQKRHKAGENIDASFCDYLAEEIEVVREVK